MIRQFQYNLSVNDNGFYVAGAKFFWKQFRRTTDYNLTQAQFTEVLRAFHAEVWKAMAEDLVRYEIPYINNLIFILEVMGTGVPKNWKQIRKKNKLVTISNLHTSGRMFKVTMKRTIKSTLATRVYRFVPVRGKSTEMYIGKRGLAAFIKARAQDPALPDFRAHIC